MKAKPGPSKRGILIVILVLAIALLMLYTNGTLHTLYIQYKLLSLQDINSRYQNAYVPTSFVRCQNTPLLQGAHINLVCTESFAPSNSTSATLPGTLTIVYYEFDSDQNARLYLRNITTFLNTTPWANGVRVSNSILTSNNLTIYYVSIYHNSSMLHAYTDSAYALRNSTVLQVAALLKNQSNNTISQSVALALLKLQYKKLFGG